MKISILSLGNELLKGTVVNSNTAIIGKELFKLGLTPCFQATVNDSSDDINQILDYLVPFCDVIIITGGLGPTSDDLTIRTVADYFKLKLYKNQGVIDNIYKRIRSINSAYGKKDLISKQNLKQAFVPENCEILMNSNGTAPGVFIYENHKRIFLLPGPPHEMQPMLLQKVIPEISSLIDSRLHFEIINTIGVSESNLQGIIDEVIGVLPDIKTAYRANPGICELTIYGHSKELVNEQAKKVRHYLGRLAIAEGFHDIVEEVVFKLNEENMTFATAESCTGGMIAAKITDFPGVSSLFKGSCVTYSNTLKQDLLGVRPDTIIEYGAVSSECALEMVNGLCKRLNVDAGIAVTGIAGPDGGTKEKPVGLIYIAAKVQDKVQIKKYILSGDRNRIRSCTVIYGLDLLRQLLLS